MLRMLGVAAVVVAAGFAGWSGWTWWDADQTAAREAALDSGRRAIATFNTLDYRRIDEGLDRWQRVSTGALTDELRQTGEGSRKQIEQAKTVTEGRVLDAAITEFDPPRATVIAAVEIVVTPDGGQPVTKRSRMRAELVRTDTGWKVGALGQIPAGAV
ncbi:Mce-associated membrane protein [Kibdelosporangium phytohabitans]|nr:Mce-associated membrane protein [Kibdelosporangium phytohabitans]